MLDLVMKAPPSFSRGGRAFALLLLSISCSRGGGAQGGVEVAPVAEAPVEAAAVVAAPVDVAVKAPVTPAGTASGARPAGPVEPVGPVGQVGPPTGAPVVVGPAGPVSPTGQPIVGPPTGPVIAGPVTPSAGELAELMASVNRKMVHDDGKGCLAELARVEAIDPRLAKTMVVVRAQCEMLVGRCELGKRMIADYYRDQAGFGETMAIRSAESIAAMRCRGGDISERDQLLQALWELSDGAYMNERSARSCLDNIAKVRRLGPRVQPRDPEDSQVRGGQQALFHTGAACLARAGDCGAAWRVYWDNFPAGSLDSVPEAAQRRTIVEESFRSSIERCKAAKLP